METYRPVSTYRLQFSRLFTFRQAIGILPYLEKLGIDAVYASPYLKAVPGCLHGYAITDYHRINPEIGTEEDHEAFCAALRAHGLHLILDVVPNHMAAHPDNPLWTDVMKHGERSAYAHFFDIEWDPMKPELRHKVLLPILAGSYGEVLDKNEIRVEQENGGFALRYGQTLLPLDPQTYSKRMALEELNGKEGDPASFDRLHALLERQHYRIADWRVASEEINYRRFFNINELAAVKTEDERVFEHIHKLIFQWIREGKVHGLRIDHPDGLYEPAVYFRRLQKAFAPDAPEEEKRLYIVVEKILDVQEPLRKDWLVHGTVGYEYLNLLNGLFIESKNSGALTQLYDEFIGHPIDFEKLVHDAKKSFVNQSMSSEINMLGHRLNLLSEHDRYARDYTLYDLTQAIKEILACFSVYRTYLTREDLEIGSSDERYIQEAVRKARETNGDLNSGVFDFVEKVLLSPEEAYREFALRFQQLSAPVMAKGFEDTALYVRHPLLSLNEVGSDPTRFGVEPSNFHAQNMERLRKWPGGLLAASTHDTKRSDDARHRLNVLSEIPEDWRLRLSVWAKMNERHKTLLNDKPAPTANTEYFIYQTLLGAWPDPALPEEIPVFYDRLWACIQKSLRETKLYTDWMKPNEAYENAVKKFLDALLAPGPDNLFLSSFMPFCLQLADLGRLNSLSALVLRLVSPGVFDIYQGDELWNFSLVDPDNRRPVDHVERQKVLESVLSEDRTDCLLNLYAKRAHGHIKLLLMHKGLELRRSFPELFLEGSYIPCEVSGKMKHHALSIMRQSKNMRLIAAAGRFFASMPAGISPVGKTWQETFLVLPAEAEPEWEDIYTGRAIHAFRRGERLLLPLEEIFSCSSATLLIQKT